MSTTDSLPSETSSSHPAEWITDRRLAGLLASLVDRSDLSDPDLGDAIERLAAVHGEGVFAESIFQLSRVGLTGPRARAEWHRILEHRDELARRTGEPVDLRVGLLSYFIGNRTFVERPAVVDMEWVRRTVASVHVDELTKLANFRALGTALVRELACAEATSVPLSLVVVDLDDFKAVNDSHGHAAGNEVLESIGRSLLEVVRHGDLAARYGGEEFVVLLPGTAKCDAEAVAERIRESIATRVVRLADGTTISPTASLGLATFPADATDAQELLHRADAALYKAKRDGKNVVRTYGHSSRSFSRRDACWPGTLCTVAGESMVVTTRVVGEGGILVTAPHAVAEHSLVELQTEPPAGERLLLAARVVRVNTEADGGVAIALRLIEPGSRDRSLLRDWVRGG